MKEFPTGSLYCMQGFKACEYNGARQNLQAWRFWIFEAAELCLYALKWINNMNDGNSRRNPSLYVPSDPKGALIHV